MQKIVRRRIFSDEDRKFNREMIDCARENRVEQSFPDRRGGKMLMGNRLESKILENRDYDITSEILSEFRKKWGISE